MCIKFNLFFVYKCIQLIVYTYGIKYKSLDKEKK